MSAASAGANGFGTGFFESMCSATNAWILSREGRVVTRPLSSAILGGITRQTLLRLARDAGVEVEERSFSVDEAKAAREAFITSTTNLLKPVTQDQLRVNISVAWGKFLDYAASNQEITQLKQRLEDRKIIEQAKWLLVDRKAITEPDAMKQLQRQARNHRRTLVDVARSLIENHELLNDD